MGPGQARHHRGQRCRTPVRGRISFLPPLHPCHVRIPCLRADDSRLARDRRTRPGLVRPRHDPPAHTPTPSQAAHSLRLPALRPHSSRRPSSGWTPMASPALSRPATDTPEPEGTGNSAKADTPSGISTATPPIDRTSTSARWNERLLRGRRRSDTLGHLPRAQGRSRGPGHRRTRAAGPRPVRMRQRRELRHGSGVPGRGMPDRCRAHLRVPGRPSRSSHSFATRLIQGPVGLLLWQPSDERWSVSEFAARRTVMRAACGGLPVIGHHRWLADREILT